MKCTSMKHLVAEGFANLRKQFSLIRFNGETLRQPSQPQEIPWPPLQILFAHGILE